jgi:hypothetical protein
MTSESLDRLELLEPLPLSPIESAFWRAEENLAGAYRVVIVFRLEGRIETSLLGEALRRLQHRHPKLRAMVLEDGNGSLSYHFEPPAQPIPFEIKDFDDGELPWSEETRHLLERGFPAGGPLAALTVLRSQPCARSDLLLLLHHAIADGLSAISLVHDLLTEYARGEARVLSPVLPSLPPVTVVRAKEPRGWLSRLWLLRRFMRLQRQDRRSLQTPVPQNAGVPPQSQWVHWVFSREDTLELVKRCRRKQTSLGGALIAAVCLGLTDCLRVPGGLFKCQFPLNVRDALQGPTGPVTGRDLGCFISVMNEFYEVSKNSSFWDVARHAHLTLQGFVKHGGPAFGYNMAAIATTRPFRRAATRLLNSKHRVTLLANNYGVLDISDAYGSLRPRECTLTFKNFANGPSLVAQGMIMGQQLNVGFVGDCIEEALWERLQATVRGYLSSGTHAAQRTSITP